MLYLIYNNPSLPFFVNAKVKLVNKTSDQAIFPLTTIPFVNISMCSNEKNALDIPA